MKTFLISDTHFGHANILRYEPEHRPFASIDEHNEKLIENWNRVVGKNDCVWHLGDVLFGAHNFDLLGKLNGTKKLVLGNHDHYALDKYARYFSKIHGVATLGGCVLTHVPVHVNQLARFKINIHGHMHSKKVQVFDEMFQVWRDHPSYVNVSVEQINLTPINLQQVLDSV